LIGAPGQTVWISFLLRQDSGGATPYVGLTAEGGVGAWWMNPANIELGYFGSSSNNSSGNPMWSLQYNGATVLTNVPMVTGQTALFVVEDTFGSNGSPDQINVYVNPTSLGGSAPSTPNLQYSPSGSTAFQSITYYGGNNSGQSSLGDIRVGTTYATVTPAAAVTPAAPTGLTATAGNGQVTLAWTGATGATSYNVYEGASSGGESATPIATGVTSTSFTVQGLTNGSAYYFEVAAVNANGTSSDSNEASATPFAPLTPPTGLSATAGDSQASLSWTGVTGAASYNVYQGVTSGGESGTPVATGITTATYTATGLSNGTTYFFTVTAVNSNGVSAASNEASATPAAAGTLLAYEPFGEAVGTVLNGNSGGGDFGWSEAWSDQNGHGDVPGFDVASANPIYYPGIVESANYAIGGDSYDYVGRQLNTSASGPFASYLSNGLIGAPGQTVWLSFLMREDAAGTTPSFSLSPQGGTNAWWISSPNIQIGYLGSTSNDASGNPFWSIAYGGAYATPTATVLTNAPVVAGQPTLFVMSVTFGATGANSTVNLYVNPTSLGGAAPSTPSATYTTTNSLAFQSLTYYGGTGYNTSSLDEIRVGTTYAAVTPATPVTIPSSPTSLTATAGSGAVSLAWSAVTGATSYDIYQGTTAGSENPTPVATGITGTTYTVANLANGTTYYFVVAAANSAGTGTYSNEASATPSVSAGIPAAPVLTAAAGNLQATLSWTTSTGATSYNVYQGTTSGGEGTTPIATGVTGNTYTAAGLSNETTYFFEVTATNSAGTSKVSNEASVTPAPPVSGTNAPASFSIFPQVVAANPVNAGFNMQPAAGANITENAWIADGGFAPYDERMSFTASQNGTATTFIASGGGGTSFYSSITTGYFVGATARTYRYSNGAWSLLRTDTVADYTALDDTSAADNTITFASSGPQILAGDIVWLDLDDQQTVPGLTLLDPRFTEYCANWGTEAQGSCDSRTKTLPYTLSTDVPASDTGGLSMELSDGSSENQGIWQYVQGAFVGPSYEQFQPGHTYKVDVWLKQSGIGNGSVTFSINGMGISHTFTDVTDTWQEFTWTFPAVAGLPANSVQPSVHLDYTAPGTMWVDNFKLYDAAWAPNAVDPEVMTTWQNYQPGTVRIWSNFGNASENYSFFSLDSWLTPEIKTRNTPGVGNQYEVPGELEHLPDALANVKTIGANPWLIVNMALSEVEWGELIDYLAAPAGVGYAAKRPADHPGPYTDDFSTIYLEVGNEEWGTQQVPADAAYGQWAHFVIGNAIAGKSYFNPSQLKFILNGFDLEPSFGSAAAAAAPEASMVDAALYTQGNQSLTGDAYYQSDLVQVPASNGPIIDSIVSQQQLDAANGRIYGLAAYEEGPGADTPTHSSDNSLAAGIGAIDVNLYASLRGFGPQNLFMYGLGSGPYTSHTNFANGFRPHPVWEALQMRNNYCTGPMVLTTTNSVPTTTDGNNYPLIAVYTFQDAKVTNQADVVVISRDLNNQTPVTLNFPATPTGSANLYMLTGDPRADNNEAMNTPITTTTLDGVTSSYTFTMPPGSMYVFQVPLSGTWSSSGQPTPPPPTGLLANPGNGEVTLTWAASNGATSYNVLRGSTTGGPYTQIGTTAQVAYTDSAVTNGANYYYVVQAVNGGGASSNSAEVSATPNVEDASMATVAPPLDGSDTGAWANVPFIPLPHSFDGNSTDTAAYKILWDNNNLYVLVSVQDSYLVAPTQANIYEGEAVELYFSGTDTRSTKYGPTDFQYAFPYGNGGAVVTETYHSPASLTGVQFGQQNIAGGYQMVMELPWTTLGTTPVLNQQYGFDVMIDTASAQGTLLGKLGWWATVNDTWNNPSLMGPLVLTQPTTTAQTVSFTAPSSATYGSTLSLSATASSGLAPTYSLVSGPATLNGNELTFTGLGSVVVQASQAGNNTYSAATPVSQTIAVTAAPLTVSADNLSRVYGAANPTFTGSVNGGVNGDAFTETFATTATTSSTVGAYNIVPSVTGANLGNYNVTIQDGTLTITQATPTINWAAPHAITYGTALSATQLNATSSTAGLLTYTPALGAVPNAGSQTLSVVLSPTDGTDYAKASASVQLTVNKAPTTLSLSANPNPAVQGKATLITASVTGSGQPSGTVIITSGSTTLCKASLGATGTATCSYTPTASGSFAIAASYAGDSNHLGSSGSLSLSVFDTSVTEQFSSVQLVYPGATNVTVCVAGATKATGTGTVEIEDGSTVLTTQSLQGNGCAYWYISPGLSAGAHIISSVYSGDKNNPAGASQPTTLNVSAVPVKMSASCWNSTFAYGANYQCTVNVSSNAGSALGSISYSFDGGAPVAVPLSSGNAGFTITKPLAGNHTIAIGYAQQTNYAAATTQTDSFTVTPAPITLSLTPSTWYTTTGTSIVFQAAVSSWSAGAPDDNGSISFYDGSTLLATVPVNSSGAASYSTASLPVGSDSITATYAGGANYASGSTSVTITIVK
jgi:fibronectin type 3 domain-containing protein